MLRLRRAQSLRRVHTTTQEDRMRSLRVTPVLVLAALVAGCEATQVEPLTVDVPVLFSHDDGGAHNFRTHMSGREEVPAAATRAQGQATFKLSKDGTELSYKLIVANIENVSMAHIHLA
jgi:hypothetical protein